MPTSFEQPAGGLESPQQPPGAAIENLPSFSTGPVCLKLPVNSVEAPLPNNSPAPLNYHFFALIGNELSGPLTPDQLEALALRGRLLPEHLVRLGENGKWKEARYVRGLVFAAGTVSVRESLPLPVNPSQTPPVLLAGSPVPVSQGYFFYCQIGGQFLGPLTPDQLESLALSGQLRSTDLIRLGENGKWKNACYVKGLVFGAPQVPNVPLPQISQQTPIVPPAPVLPPPAAPHVSESPPKPTKRKYYYRVGKVSIGPCTLKELQELVTNDRLHADDRVCVGENGRWHRASRVVGLKFRPKKAKQSKNRKSLQRKSEPLAEKSKVPQRSLSKPELSIDLETINGTSKKPSPESPPEKLSLLEADAEKTEFYCIMGTVPLGPFRPIQLQELANNGVLQPTHAVRVGKNGRWRPANLVEGLKFPQPDQAMDETAEDFDTVSDIFSFQSDQGQFLANRIPGSGNRGSATEDRVPAAAQHTTPPVERPVAKTQYFLRLDKEVKGPFSLAHLNQFAAKGKLLPKSLVRTGTLDQWATAENISGIQWDKAPSPPDIRDPSDWGWYYKFTDEVLGPITSKDLKELAASGKLAPSDSVRYLRKGEWRPAGSIPGLMSGLDYSSREMSLVNPLKNRTTEAYARPIQPSVYELELANSPQLPASKTRSPQ